MRGIALESLAAVEQLVEHRAEAEDVGAGGQLGVVSARLLRGHVVGRADDGSSHGQVELVALALGDPEITDERFPRFFEQDVGGFEVAVQDASLVGVVDGACDFFKKRDCGRRVGELRSPGG